ncbi:MAG: OadG family protein [Bacillota bacterium]|nr:OadG family protein [Bacillota bacterium]
MFALISYLLPILLAEQLTPLRETGSLLTDSIIGDALIIMGVGFGSVFVVLAVFYLVVTLLNRIYPARKVED